MANNEAVLQTNRRPMRPLWLLFAFVMSLGICSGGGLFESTVLVPLWTASPEAVRGWNANPNYLIIPGRFFVFGSSLPFLLSLMMLIVGWRTKQQSLRKLILWSAGLFLLIFLATVFYFLPRHFGMMPEATRSIPDAELMGIMRRWVIFNWVRQIILIISFALALLAFGRAFHFARRASDTEAFTTSNAA